MHPLPALPPLPDSNHLLAIAAVVTGVVLLVVQLLKPFLERWVKPDDSLHDVTLRLTTFIAALVCMLVAVYAPAVFNLIALCLGIAAGAMGSFHLLNQSSAAAATLGGLASFSAPDEKSKPAELTPPVLTQPNL